MKLLLILLLFIIPLREVENVQLSFPAPAHQQAIFFDYENDNFSQELNINGEKITADLKSINFIHLNLNFRIFLDKKELAKLDRKTREIVIGLFDNNITLKNYFRRISDFLEKSIEYTEAELPQDEMSVLMNRKANCVGFSNLARFLLNCVGIKNKFAKGFYLMRENGKTIIPVPHKWIEIHLSNGVRFFYDPQRQRFSAYYIVAKDDVDFRKIRKFTAILIKKSKEVLN